MDKRILTYRLTCSACPTQYDFFLEDGRYIYFRYRWGTWEMRLFPSFDYAEQCSPEVWLGTLTLTMSIGEPLDGFLEEDEVLSIVDHNLDELLA